MPKKKTILITFLAIILGLVGLKELISYQVMYPKVLTKKSGPIKIAAVGDSITFGSGVLGHRDTESYPALLASELGKKYQVSNYGLRSRTMSSEGNLPYFREKNAKLSLESNADIVIIMLGTNDSKPRNWNEATYKKDYIAAIKRYQNMPSHPKVYIMIPPRVFVTHKSDNAPRNSIVNGILRQLIPQIAKETGVTYIDQYSVTKSHPEWFADNLHPDVRGNKAMVAQILKKWKEVGQIK